MIYKAWFTVIEIYRVYVTPVYFALSPVLPWWRPPFSTGHAHSAERQAERVRGKNAVSRRLASVCGYTLCKLQLCLNFQLTDTHIIMNENQTVENNVFSPPHGLWEQRCRGARLWAAAWFPEVTWLRMECLRPSTAAAARGCGF